MQIYEKQSGQSKPSPAEGSKADGARFTFVLCEHTPEGVAEVAEALKDCDVVAIECSGAAASEAERDEINTLLSAYTQPDVPEDVEQKVSEFFTEGFDDTFLENLVGQFRGSGKAIRLIDMNTDDPNYHLSVEHGKASRAVLAAVDNLRPNSEIKTAIENRIHIVATSDPIREEGMANELRAMGREMPDSHIGVALGLHHSSVHRAISREFPVTHAYRDVLQPNQPKVIVRYSYADQAINELCHGLREDVNPELLDRSLLELVFDTYGGEVRRVGQSGERSASYPPQEFKFEIIDEMSHKEVQELLTQIDAVKAKDRSRTNPAFVGVQVYIEINDLLRKAMGEYLPRPMIRRYGKLATS